ncbi:helix-turn-helix transcriptional regulator [Polynucleobacter sp. MWH-CaK5]|jgi:transcriptional regulator with XRE-family HTH domain|nr:helix-turn-helix transcriptional regulator [Polynucleobacter sp. MWH-CaK5]
MLLPQHTQPLPIINGDNLKKARTDKNLTEAELAKECALVAKHIIQLENGETSNFFSAHHKVQVAKKVGRYLGLDEYEFLDSSST